MFEKPRIAYCHSSGVAKQSKRDSRMDYVMKSPRSNGHKPFASLSLVLPCVTQPKTLCNQARITLYHSFALSEQIKRDSQAVKKLHDTIGG